VHQSVNKKTFSNNKMQHGTYEEIRKFLTQKQIVRISGTAIGQRISSKVFIFSIVDFIVREYPLLHKMDLFFMQFRNVWTHYKREERPGRKKRVRIPLYV
jgi:hypothetical protein